MRTNIRAVAAVVCIAAITAGIAVARAHTGNKNAVDAEKRHVLVVYYSATGTTARVAGYIASVMDADLMRLECVNPYTEADLDWRVKDSRVMLEYAGESKRKVELVSTAVDGWEDYDTVFIGYPIWCGMAAWPVNGFVEANDFTGKTVVPFCTAGSSGIGKSGKLLEKSAGTGTWLDGERFLAGATEADVRAWLEETGLYGK